MQSEELKQEENKKSIEKLEEYKLSNERFLEQILPDRFRWASSRPWFEALVSSATNKCIHK